MISSLFFEKPDVWDYLQNTDKPILMYGMGNGAEKILDVFKKYEIHVNDIFTSDDFYHEKEFRGFKLKSYSMIEQEYNEAIIVLAFAIFREDMLSRIREISERFEVLAPEVPVFGTDYFSKSTLHEYAEQIKLTYNLLYDNKSQQIFRDILEYRLTGRLEPLFSAETDRADVFENIIKLSDNESYLDLGAYRGDTIEEFLVQTQNKFDNIYALEPDAKNYKKLCEYVKLLDYKDKIKVYNMASWDSRKLMTFDGGGGRNSSLGDGQYTVHTTDIDTLSRDFTSMPTYIKMDVEGAEYETLCGMKSLISTYKPKLIVAAYHKTCDVFTLPALIKSLNPEYKIYLRHHPYIPDWETNLYCI